MELAQVCDIRYGGTPKVIIAAIIFVTKFSSNIRVQLAEECNFNTIST